MIKVLYAKSSTENVEAGPEEGQHLEAQESDYFTPSFLNLIKTKAKKNERSLHLYFSKFPYCWLSILLLVLGTYTVQVLSTATQGVPDLENSSMNSSMMVSLNVNFWGHNNTEYYWIYPHFCYILFHNDEEHFMQNVAVFVVFGLVLELLYDHTVFLLVTFSSALGGSLVYLVFNPDVALYGLSSVIYGYCGFFIGSAFITQCQKSKGQACSLREWVEITFAVLVGIALLLQLIPLYKVTLKDICGHEIAHSSHFGGALFGLPCLLWSVKDAGKKKKWIGATFLVVMTVISVVFINWRVLKIC